MLDPNAADSLDAFRQSPASVLTQAKSVLFRCGKSYSVVLRELYRETIERYQYEPHPMSPFLYYVEAGESSSHIFDQDRLVCPACFAQLHLDYRHVRLVTDTTRPCVCSQFTPLTLSGTIPLAASPWNGTADYSLSSLVSASLELLRSCDPSPDCFDQIFGFLTDFASASPIFSRQISLPYIDVDTISVVFHALSTLHPMKAIHLLHFLRLIIRDDESRFRFLTNFFSQLLLLDLRVPGREHVFDSMFDLIGDCWEYLPVARRVSLLLSRGHAWLQFVLPFVHNRDFRHDFFADFRLFLTPREVVEQWTQEPLFYHILQALLNYETAAMDAVGLETQRKISETLELLLPGRVEWRNGAEVLKTFTHKFVMHTEIDRGSFGTDFVRRSVCTEGVFVAVAAPVHSFVFRDFALHTAAPDDVWEFGNATGLLVLPFRILAFSAFVTLGVDIRRDCCTIIENGDFRYDLPGMYTAAVCGMALAQNPERYLAMARGIFDLDAGLESVRVFAFTNFLWTCVSQSELFEWDEIDLAREPLARFLRTGPKTGSEILAFADSRLPYRYRSRGFLQPLLDKMTIREYGFGDNRRYRLVREWSQFRPSIYDTAMDAGKDWEMMMVVHGNVAFRRVDLGPHGGIRPERILFTRLFFALSYAIFVEIDDGAIAPVAQQVFFALVSYAFSLQAPPVCADRIEPIAARTVDELARAVPDDYGRFLDTPIRFRDREPRTFRARLEALPTAEITVVRPDRLKIRREFEAKRRAFCPYLAFRGVRMPGFLHCRIEGRQIGTDGTRRSEQGGQYRLPILGGDFDFAAVDVPDHALGNFFTGFGEYDRIEMCVKSVSNCVKRLERLSRLHEIAMDDPRVSLLLGSVFRCLWLEARRRPFEISSDDLLDRFVVSIVHSANPAADFSMCLQAIVDSIRDDANDHFVLVRWAIIVNSCCIIDEVPGDLFFDYHLYGPEMYRTFCRALGIVPKAPAGTVPDAALYRPLPPCFADLRNWSHGYPVFVAAVEQGLSLLSGESGPTDREWGEPDIVLVLTGRRAGLTFFVRDRVRKMTPSPYLNEWGEEGMKSGEMLMLGVDRVFRLTCRFYLDDILLD
jgi:hypothetical protein